jgi:oxidoreductase
MNDAGSSAPVRTALVGLGWVARSVWLPRLASHASFRVTAVVDPDPAACAAALRESGDANPLRLTTAEELTANRVDLAIVAVPNYRHAATACTLLTAGIPVFVEKPVCLTVAEADQLAKAERAGAMLLAGSAACYRSDVRLFLQQVRRVGQIRHMELAWTRARGVPGRGSWFTERELAGGGALTDLGWHLLDIGALVLGHAGLRQVCGTVSADFLRDPAAEAGWRQAAADTPGQGHADVEDTAHAFLITGDGTSVALHTSWASHQAADTTLIRVDGSAGSVTLRCTFGFSPNRVGASSLTWTRNGATTVLPVPEEPVGSEYGRQLDELPVQLGDPGRGGTAVTRARWIAEVVERIYQSANQPALADAGTGSVP